MSINWTLGGPKSVYLVLEGMGMHEDSSGCVGMHGDARGCMGMQFSRCPFFCNFPTTEI